MRVRQASKRGANPPRSAPLRRLSSATVSEIVRRILQVSSPERVFLFGSAALGQMTRDSDIDLLVVERGVVDSRARSVAIGDSLRGIGFPFDVIVITQQRFDETKDLVGSIAHPASVHGRVIYGSP